MPSDASPRSRAWALLSSQGLGMICGQLTVALLAVGSLVIVATREGASAEVGFDDLTAFFRRPSWVHSWFYALVATLALYSLNTLLCTLDSVVMRWRRGVRELSAYAPAIIHVALLCSLLAHGVGGLWSQEGEPSILSESWSEMADMRQGRLLKLDQQTNPDGRPGRADATIELRDPDGRLHVETVGHNAPYSTGLGSRLVLLAQAGQRPSRLLLSVDGAPCTATVGGSCEVAGHRLVVADVSQSDRFQGAPVALLELLPARGTVEQLYLLAGQARTARAGLTVRFDQLATTPAVMLRERHAPGNPWALLSAVLLAVGLLAMGRRWL